MKNKLFECKYGHFSEDGMEYIITRPDTPKPWINVISNGDYGITVGQTGTGFSWMTNANINRLTRFSQDMVEDTMGKFIYLRDNDIRRYWSASWKPVCEKPDSYECRHGIGYSIITSSYCDISTKLTMFVPPEESAEIWILVIRNNDNKRRNLSAYSYLEWNLGVSPFENREFQKIFFDNNYSSDLDAFITTKRLWEIDNRKKEILNSDWNYTAFHSASERPASYDGDRESFIGMYGTRAKPAAMSKPFLAKNTGKWVDSIASLQFDLCLEPGAEKTLIFTTGLSEDRLEVQRLIEKYKDINAAYRALDDAKAFWKKYLDASVIETPDKAMDTSVNIWLKYQTISCRLWSRTAYYQSGGAYGFRDQLQDSQLFLTFMPELTKKQILLHSRHQYKDGTVKHWWHPITEEGPDSRFSDDLLWLPFVVCNYIQETADYSILDAEEPFLDGGSGNVYDHCRRSIDRAFHRFSPRGIPLIGEADWNDGLSACGTEWVGESFWVGEFLYHVAQKFISLCRKQGDIGFAERCSNTAGYLKENINKHGWDGEWYLQCTTDTGKVLGSRKCDEGSIFLNPQVWAILSGIVPDDRLDTVVKAIEKFLIKDYGPLLLWPAYTVPDSEVGYLTRYAPGLRENGGVYTHAATWLVQAFCQLKKPEMAYDIFKKICVLNRFRDIDLYKAEPYVLPGNTDGLDSPNYGQGGWTWYTGSAAWLFRVVHEHILGIRPMEAGLVIDPCIPSEWDGYKVKRPFRGAVYNIEVVNPKHVSYSVREIIIDDRPIEGNILSSGEKGGIYNVKAIMG